MPRQFSCVSRNVRFLPRPICVHVHRPASPPGRLIVKQATATRTVVFIVDFVFCCTIARSPQRAPTRVCILLPTAGENLEVVFKALVGALSQRLWDSGLPGSQTLRVIVLDEKRRLEVYRVAAGVHRIGELLAGRRIQQILMVSFGSFRFAGIAPYLMRLFRCSLLRL